MHKAISSVLRGGVPGAVRAWGDASGWPQGPRELRAYAVPHGGKLAALLNSGLLGCAAGYSGGWVGRLQLWAKRVFGDRLRPTLCRLCGGGRVEFVCLTRSFAQRGLAGPTFAGPPRGWAAGPTALQKIPHTWGSCLPLQAATAT